MKLSYYQRNKHLWRKGGKYYNYQPRVSTDKIIIKRGLFIVRFD